MPSATTMQCSPMWRPSINSATRLNASSAVDRQAASCAAVFRTNRRLTALLLVPRTRTSSPTGSKLRPYCRVATPRSICSTTRRFNGSVSANASNVGSATSAPAARTRGRRICTCRPPRTTALVTVPARDAARAGRCSYRGPQIAVRSASSIVWSTFRPDATASSISSARVSTRRSTRGRWRWRGESTWCDRSTVRDSRFMAAPAGGLFALA